MSKLFPSMILVCVLLCLSSSAAFKPQLLPAARSGTLLSASRLHPQDSKVLVVGLGALPLLTMKTAFFAGYKEVLYILPEVQHAKCAKLMFGDDYEMATDGDGYLVTPETSSEGFGANSCGGRLKFLDGSNSEDVASVEGCDGMIFCGDEPSPPVPWPVAEYLLDACGPSLKQVALNSKTFNEEGYGFVVKAARKTANKNIWDQDGKEVAVLKDFEGKVKGKGGEGGFDVTVTRSGTLKGGGWGSTDPLADDVPSVGPEAYGLSDGFYEAVKRDIVNFNLLFDCEVSWRGAGRTTLCTEIVSNKSASQLTLARADVGLLRDARGRGARGG